MDTMDPSLDDVYLDAKDLRDTVSPPCARARLISIKKQNIGVIRKVSFLIFSRASVRHRIHCCYNLNLNVETKTHSCPLPSYIVAHLPFGCHGHVLILLSDRSQTPHFFSKALSVACPSVLWSQDPLVSIAVTLSSVLTRQYSGCHCHGPILCYIT